MADHALFEQTHLEQKAAEDDLRTHHPEQDIYEELICVKCRSAAPCDIALGLMKKIQQCRRIRIRARARGEII